MVLDDFMDTLLYATYFGGTQSNEHVDGGTSRFDKKGVIYQSVCAGCGGNSDFPIEPSIGAVSSTNNSFNCNNAQNPELCAVEGALQYFQACRKGKTKPEKTEQDKTRQGRPRQEATREDKTSQEKTRQEKAEQQETRNYPSVTPTMQTGTRSGELHAHVES